MSVLRAWDFIPVSVQHKPIRVAVHHQNLAFTYEIDGLLRLLPSQNKPQVDLLTPSLEALHVL